MAKALTTPIVIPNCTRLACLDLDLSNNGTTITKATVKIQLRPAAGGLDEPEQKANAYHTYTMEITDGVCDKLTVATSGNMFHGALLQSTVNAPVALSNLLTAVNAANNAQKHNAVLISMASSGLIPAVDA